MHILTYERFLFGGSSITPGDEDNSSKLKKIPHFLKESGMIENLLGLKISKIEIKPSPSTKNVIFIDLTDEVRLTTIRMTFIKDENDFILRRGNCFYIKDGKILMNTQRDRFDDQFGDMIEDILMLQYKLFHHFIDIGLAR